MYENIFARWTTKLRNVFLLLLMIRMAKGFEYCWDGKNSTAYKGDHSVTRSGRTCQEWTSSSPHQSLYQEDFNFPLDGYSATSAKNYCRDPGGEEEGSPWCYTTDPLTEWEYCDPPTCQMSQWVSNVLDFSSQFSNTFGSARSVEGAPDVYPSSGNISGAWQPSVRDLFHFIEIEYSTPVYVQSIGIYETFNVGGVTGVLGRNPEDQWEILWESPGEMRLAVNPFDLTKKFSPRLKEVDYKIRHIRLEIDCHLINTCPHIDAVQLNGTTVKLERILFDQNYMLDDGVLTSPNYPKFYENMVSCVWVITIDGGEGEAITFIFTDMDLEEDEQCRYDFVETKDGLNEFAPAIGLYCGKKVPASFNTSENGLYVKFQSDMTVTGTGFAATWGVAEAPYCYTTYYMDSGILISPNYRDWFSYGDTCIWIIIANNPNDVITFTFIEINLGHDLACNVDYVVIRDGPDETSPLIEHYCGYPDLYPAPAISTGNAMFIQFESTVGTRKPGSGFRAVWNVGQCGGNYNYNFGHVVSPNYPRMYKNGVVCIWTITIPAGAVMAFRFTDIDIEDHIDCQYDSVEVRDGPDVFAPLLGRFCGNTLPAPVTSTRNTLYLRFTSDMAVAGAGFRAIWFLIDLFSSTQTSLSTYDARMRTSPNLPTSDANASTNLLTSDASTSPILPTTDNSTSTNSLTTDDSFDENRYTFPGYNVGCSLCVPHLICICCAIYRLLLKPISVI